MQLPGQKVHQINQLLILFAVLGFPIWPAAEAVQAQALKARITVASLSSDRILIEGECPVTDSWSFRNIYGRVTGLGDRIENFQVSSAEGEDVSVQKIAPGEFRSSKRVSRFSYEVRAGERPRLAEMAQVSWLNADRGLLMLADLFPQRTKEQNLPPAVVEFKLPAGWSVSSSLRPDENQRYLVSDADDAVFYVGRSLREKNVVVDSMELVLITSGPWAFADDDAIELVTRILKKYSKLTKHRLRGRSALLLAPFAARVGPERWSAETRGSNVVLLLGQNASRRSMLARLGIVLTHELFHLWVPSALAFEGDYDWFFEGFTLYQALLTALDLNLIGFGDYLDTMGRVYDSYLSLPDRDRLSLVEASELRWTNSPSFVYDKGMLVAFIYDLKVRLEGSNRASLADIYRRLFAGSDPGQGNANEVIISILNETAPGSPAGQPRWGGGAGNQFGERYVRTPGGIELPALLAPYGLRVETLNFRTRIVVNEGSNTEQLRLLRSLGYNP